MRWPDWFGRRAKAELENLRKTHDAALNALETQSDSYDRLHERNLRLISDLRQMDQWTYQLVQHAPNWQLMQPIVARMNEVVEKRMENESKRVRDLVVGEIVTAYNEPPKVRTTLPPDNWRIFNQGKPVKTIDGEAKYVGEHHNVPIYEVPKIKDKK